MSKITCVLTTLFVLTTVGLNGLNEAPGVFKPGRALFFLHEITEINAEQPHKKEIGGVTLQAISAFAQEAGILVLSPTIWLNILTRWQQAEQMLAKKKSLFSLFQTSWRENATKQSLAKVYFLLKTDRSLLPLSYVAEQREKYAGWRCLLHGESGLIVLIPERYIQPRLEIVPRPAAREYAMEEYATGLRLSHCKKIELNDLKAAIAQARALVGASHFDETTLSALFLVRDKIHPLLRTTWNCYVTGHGLYPASGAHDKNAVLCGLRPDSFYRFLHWCDEALHLHTLFYQSCFGGGVHLSNINASTRQEKKQQGLHYTLVAGAIGETPVHITLPRVGVRQDHQAAALTIKVDSHFDRFFELIEEGGEWSTILRAITPAAATRNDPHGISATPLLLKPGAKEAVPVDVTVASAAFQHTSNRNSIAAGLAAFTEEEQAKREAEGSSFIVRGKRALLVSPAIIRTPIEIHPYQRILRSTKKSSFTVPAIASMLPGAALHHFTDVTLHDSGLKNLIIQGFTPLAKQRSTKTFLFDQLTVHNDLNSPHAGSPRITLKQALFIVGVEKITGYFLTPDAHGKYQAYRLSIPRGQEMQSLPLEEASTTRHGRLFKKYARLCKEQAGRKAARA